MATRVCSITVNVNKGRNVYAEEDLEKIEAEERNRGISSSATALVSLCCPFIFQATLNHRRWRLLRVKPEVPPFFHLFQGGQMWCLKFLWCALLGVTGGEIQGHTKELVIITPLGKKLGGKSLVKAEAPSRDSLCSSWVFSSEWSTEVPSYRVCSVNSAMCPFSAVVTDGGLIEKTHHHSSHNTHFTLHGMAVYCFVTSHYDILRNRNRTKAYL